MFTRGPAEPQFFKKLHGELPAQFYKALSIHKKTSPLLKRIRSPKVLPHFRKKLIAEIFQGLILLRSQPLSPKSERGVVQSERGTMVVAHWRETFLATTSGVAAPECARTQAAAARRHKGSRETSACSCASWLQVPPFLRSKESANKGSNSADFRRRSGRGAGQEEEYSKTLAISASPNSDKRERVLACLRREEGVSR